MARYRRRPVEVEAFQWDGNAKVGDWPEWAQLAAGRRRLVYFTSQGHPRLRVYAPGGPLDACRDHWITQNADGDLDHFTPSGFEATYEPVTPDKAGARVKELEAALLDLADQVEAVVQGSWDQEELTTERAMAVLKSTAKVEV